MLEVCRERYSKPYHNKIHFTSTKLIHNIYDIAKVKLVTCYYPKLINTETSKLINVLQNSVYS